MGNQKATICASCAELAALPGQVSPHKYMLVEGQRTSNVDGSCDITYRCLECDTVWIRHTDKWRCQGGFQLMPNVS